jgi:hypothetical protein
MAELVNALDGVQAGLGNTGQSYLHKLAILLEVSAESQITEGVHRGPLHQALPI